MEKKKYSNKEYQKKGNSKNSNYKKSNRNDSNKRSDFNKRGDFNNRNDFNKRPKNEYVSSENFEKLKKLEGKVIKVECKELDEAGKGIAFYQGLQLHIPNFLPHEEADVKVERYKGKIDARVINLIKSSPIRVKCRCDVFNSCGGCQYQHISYADQLTMKDQYVKEKFKDLRGKYKIYPIIGMDDFDHYRCKNQMVYGTNKNGKIIAGFYEEDTHKIVNYEECMIQDNTANRIMKTVKKLMLKYNVIPYNEDSEQGLLRHVFVRVGKHTNEVLVALVTASEFFPGRKDFVRDLRNEHPEITTIIQNINDTPTNMVLGERERVLFGDGYITDILCGLKFQISSTSFYQVNPIQTEKLYNKAIEYAEFSPNDFVLDAYSGIGTIGLIASKKCREVISVELNTQAFKDAIKNAKINNIKNVYFYNADATEFMKEMAESNERLDVLLMDPPRSGATEEFLYSAQKLKPRKIVYISCNIETQVRDLKQLVRSGYEIMKVQPVDMFPSTKHVECVVGLQLKNT